jgi:predicted SAM-dependent methyltransferase
VPFTKNSINIAYASHFLEHLPKKNALKFLNRCFTILKPGGIIRLVVPDIDIIINKYQKDSIKDNIAATNELNLRFFEDGQHKHMYNYKTLSTTLTSIGFKNVKKLDFRKSKIKDINKLETLKLKYYTSLYIEAIK